MTKPTATRELLARRRTQPRRSPRTQHNPSETAFERSLSVWNQRRRRMGDGAVGKQGEDAIAQGHRIEKKLSLWLGEPHYEHAIDFGCGWGRFSKLLSEHCQHLWSVDLFDDWVGRAAAAPTATGVVLKTPQLPLDSQSMNLIVDITTFQSIEQAALKDQYAAELRRIAVPDAKFISLYKVGDSWCRDRLPKAIGLRDYNPAYFSVGTEDVDEDGASYYFLVGKICGV